MAAPSGLARQAWHQQTDTVGHCVVLNGLNGYLGNKDWSLNFEVITDVTASTLGHCVGRLPDAYFPDLHFEARYYQVIICSCLEPYVWNNVIIWFATLLIE